jgi:hypothetical protein
MRKRRHTRFDSRLNSIIEPRDSQSKERWVQDGINASVISRVNEGGKDVVDTINDEDKEDFMQYKNYSHRSDSISSESRGNVL